MPTPSKVLLFTGLIRHPEMFERQLEICKDLPCIGRKILSTWTDEYEKNAGFLKRLSEQFGIEIVHRQQPPVSLGYFLHQMCSLENGLAQVEQGDIVCKTRSDIVVTPEALDYVFNMDRSLAPSPLRDYLQIGSRISVVEAQINCPFMFDDILFCGVASDLKRFVNLEMKFELIYRCNTPVHERYWGTYFDEKFQFLQDYYKTSWIFGGDDSIKWSRILGNEYRRSITDFALRDRAYGMMMALSFIITSEMFSVNWGAQHAFFDFKGRWGSSRGPRWHGRSFDGCRTLTEVFSQSSFSDPEGLVSCNSDRSLQRLAKNDFDDCDIGRNMSQCLDAVRAATVWDLQNLADMKAFSARALGQSKQIIHDMLPRFQEKARDFASAGQIDQAHALINNLVLHLSA